MIVQDAYEIWNEAEEIRDRISALRDRIQDLGIEPEMLGKLNCALVEVSGVIARVRRYDVTEDATAKNRRADWGSQIILPPGFKKEGDDNDQHNPSD